MSAARSVAMLFRLRFQVGDVDVALLVAPDDHDLHAGHHGGGGIGAVRGRGDEADRAAGIPVGFVPCADHQQSGVLSLCAGIRLQRGRGKAR